MANEKKIVFQSEWDRKFIKESWTFPFGSLMSAYAALNEGKGFRTSFESFKEDALQLQELAMEMTEKALLRSQQGDEDKDEPDVPL